MYAQPVLKRVVIANYKSIAFCDVTLGPLTFLVGLNGSGKSNFIDALRFVRDALKGSLDHAFAVRRANLQSISRHPASDLGFGMRLDLDVNMYGASHYAFWIAPEQRGVPGTHEECRVGSDFFSTSIRSDILPPPPRTGRLYLGNLGGAFDAVHETLTSMEFYSPEPQSIKNELYASGSEFLESDGRNVASIFDQIDQEDKTRILEYMSRIMPGLTGIRTQTVEAFKILRFEQARPSNGGSEFSASRMSDGTLRALTILTAIFQKKPGPNLRPSLIAIEEPETSLHPAAMALLFDGLKEGAHRLQLVATSHSADLIDNAELESDSILAVDNSSGTTHIAPIDEVSRSILKDRLRTPGELLRMDQLRPDESSAIPASVESVLFEGP